MTKNRYFLEVLEKTKKQPVCVKQVNHRAGARYQMV